MTEQTIGDSISTDNPVNAAMARVLDDVRREDHPGHVADYIPQLAKVDPDQFGIASVSVRGHSYAAGDYRVQFTIQSMSKPFVYALALQELGTTAVCERIGVEPSGEAFNAISFDPSGRPENPLINAGAIVSTSLISAETGDERFAKIRAGLSRFAGRELELDESVYKSESETGFRNLALAALAKSTNALRVPVEDALDPYFRQCSLLVDAHDIAVMGATLANSGVNPCTGERVVDTVVARHTLSVMTGCGMYDRSGAWMCSVGIPAKSGVGGGIVAAAPGEYGVGVFSPPLDEAGNSARGVAVLQKMSSEFGLHLLDRPMTPVSALESITTDPATGHVTLRLRGEVDFVAVEEVVHEALKAGRLRQGTTVVLDLTNATRVSVVATYLINQLISDVGYGARVIVVDPSGLLTN
ncbi:Glutaminase OS=Tsukamurella paurometabola (strain ATCC 8368 / DSM / CCUG 35730 / CIP 100753/ JCM 10117 / KCTC 9821 / NBRC 16120 / NCIMB 702349 / NCTC 13040)OX=521096 GN=glsA PE=3 SV=1 [Tsukamurella paurometabola]|uniref:Glutaminase n=1 Tax=Tsukamurella paurometabola (strain ATCC 8368 / DSM 20162 / CCUG 35730 / CIP 100753 / JCM 10117 / KCTC 9821 / NBRC 16120 / NCIMB 702349 / NCTC 13040) TaxID=521096 RepID=D5US20_TSUPD|nr:glutaminase A [Tsukamurella paurometabola]ADG77087.1 Glutaminase [Tsukamurella paurometabola DSM 20162]SUP42729.1 Glutaminase 1 [Tsukamurella paurometabola]